MTVDELVLLIAGTLAVAGSLAVLVVTRPRPRSVLEVGYLVVPVLGVIAIVAAVARG